MDLQHDGYFTNLMQSDSQEEENLMESQYCDPNAQVFTPETPIQLGSISKKRGGNFTIEEDKLLVSAWLNISLDPIQGKDQKKTAFWLRVKDYYDEHKQFDSDRTTVSLCSRWGTIQQCTNKFCSCFAKIELLNQSGLNEENKMANAKEAYKKQVGSAFQLDHCWVMLKNQPKWFLEREKKLQSNRPTNGRSTGPSTPLTINLEDDNVTTEDVVELKRPIGVKKAKKDQAAKRKSKDITSSTQFAEALEEIATCKRRLVEKKLEWLGTTYDQETEKIRMKKERLELDQQRLELDQFKEDERVMMMDLTGLSEERQEFYKYRQMEILEKRRAK